MSEISLEIMELYRKLDKRNWWIRLGLYFIVLVFIFLLGICVGAYLYATRTPTDCDVLLQVDRTIGSMPIRCIREMWIYMFRGNS